MFPIKNNEQEMTLFCGIAATQLFETQWGGEVNAYKLIGCKGSRLFSKHIHFSTQEVLSLDSILFCTQKFGSYIKSLQKDVLT